MTFGRAAGLRSLLLVSAVLVACGGRASAQAGSAAAKSSQRASSCPSVEDVSTAAGFPVALKTAGGSQDSFLCGYEVTGAAAGVGPGAARVLYGHLP